MANPNLVNISSVLAKTTGAALGTDLTTSLLANSASSGKVFKINTVIVTNVDGSNSANVSLEHYDGSNSRRFASTISIPADTTLIALDKNSAIYLEEGHSIRGGASASGDLECIISYEELS